MAEHSVSENPDDQISNGNVQSFSEKIQDWTRDTIRNRASAPRHALLDFARQNFNQINLFHAPDEVSLDAIFVSPCLQLLRNGNGSRQKLPKRLRTGRHKIWAFLNAGVEAKRNFVILGPPGSGKTTLLRYIAYQLTSESHERREKGLPEKLPILLDVRDLNSMIADYLEMPLDQMISHILGLRGVRIQASWFAEILYGGDSLISLDGLDELGNADQRRVFITWFESQMSEYSRSRFILTSHSRAYVSNRLSDVSVLKLAPFQDEGVYRLVSNWQQAGIWAGMDTNSEGEEPTPQDVAERFIEKLHAATGLSATPLNPALLGMMATVLRDYEALPARLSELYETLCQAMFDRFANSERGDEISGYQAQHVLGALAFGMMQRNQREIAPQDAHYDLQQPLSEINTQMRSTDFLSSAAAETGLILESSSGAFRFVHITIQEFLVAAYLRRQDLEIELTKNLEDERWRQVVLHYAALGNASGIIATCLAANPVPLANLRLAVECLEASIYVDPVEKSHLEAILRQEPNRNGDVAYRQGLADILVEWRLLKFKQFDQDRLVDSSLLTQTEYQSFLSQQINAGFHRHPDHWMGGISDPEKGGQPIMGVRPADADAFCAWLNESEETQWYYRLPTKNEFADDPTGAARMPDSSQSGYWATAGDSYACRLPSEVAVGTSSEILQRYQQEDLSVDLDSYRDIARDLGIDLALEDALAHAGEYDFESEKKLRYYRPIDLEGTVRRAQAVGIDLNINLQLASILIRVRSRSREIASHLARTASFMRDLSKATQPAILERVSENIDEVRSICEDAKQLVRTLDAALESGGIAEVDVRAVRAAAGQLLETLSRVDALERILDRLAATGAGFSDHPDLERAREAAQDFGLGEGSVLTQARVLMRAAEDALSTMRENGSARNFHPDVFRNIESDWREVAELIRWYIRIRAVGKAYELKQQLSTGAPSSISIATQSQLDICLNVYIDMVFLEERIRGKLPAFEGIRIVKQRKYFEPPKSNKLLKELECE